MKMQKSCLLVLLWVVVWSCKKDDDPAIETIPPRLLTEVSVEDDAEIKAYLQTHFYNYEDFENPPADFDFRIRIDTIAGDNSGKISLMDMPAPHDLKQRTVFVSSSHYSLSSGEEDIPHTFYYLSARDGVGEQLSVADSTYVRYEGSLLDGSVFDGATSIPTWFDLARIQAPQQGARGFSEGTSNFKAGGMPVINDDGTFTVEGYGVGFMIFPSGLGYFNVSQTTIPAYSPLIFKVDVFAKNESDHDQDGIPSIMEDVNGDGYLYNDNTDQALEDANNFQRVVNFVDVDDDGDGTLTRDEISDADGNIILPYPDTDGDGIPDYLDPDTN